MRKLFGVVAIVVGILFALVGAVALLKTGQTLIGIAALTGGGVLIAIGFILRFSKKRRSSKRSSGHTKRKPTKPTPKQKPKPEPKPAPKPQPKPAPKPEAVKAEKERPIAPQKPAEKTVAPELPVEETVDVGAEVQALAEAFRGTYVYESENAIAKVKEVSCALTEEEVYEITLDVEISFFQGKVSGEAETKAETNHIIAAINDKLKSLRAKLDKLGVRHDVFANYDFNE